MKNQPLVSVLMNCYNGERYLNEAIDSVYAQTYQNFEILFIDNCSIDDSAKIAREYDHRLKYYKTHKNISLGEARNWAMQFVAGKYLAFLDVDDLWLPQKLQLQVEQLENNLDYNLSYTGNYIIDEKSIVVGKKRPKLNSGYVFPALLKRYEINQQTVLLRFDRRYCYFSGEYNFCPDYNIFMRVSAEFEVGVINQCLVNYRKHSLSLTSNKVDRWWIEGKMTLDCILNSNPELKERYPREFSFAYAKILFYKSIYFLSIGDDAQARLQLKKIRFRSEIFFVTYIISLFSARFLKKTYSLYSGREI
jgi:glycosyltransferase involved in cell wall biosynthesis